jgi:hypothetical protein
MVEPVLFFSPLRGHVPPTNVHHTNFMPFHWLDASCSICCSLDSPVSLAVESDAVVARAVEPRVAILAIPDMVVRIQG